jgi:hypothetical protein
MFCDVTIRHDEVGGMVMLKRVPGVGEGEWETLEITFQIQLYEHQSDAVCLLLITRDL